MSIQTELTRITNAKAAIKTAIEGKGVTVPDGTLLDGMAALIDAIEAGGGGATEPYIEEVYDGNGKLIDVTFHGYTIIRTYAFYNCSKLALTSLPSGITSIGTYAFDGCSSLASLTFEGTPNSIAKTAFSGCTNLTTINVPWADGAVANAPWGATNATINYNYTGA